MKREKRYHIVPELRSVDDSKRTIGGYAAIFDKETELFPGLLEKIARGAFIESIGKDDIRALWSHNPDYPLGRNRNNTLKLWEDEKGLGFQLDLPDTQSGRDAYELITKGVVTGMSFGFSVLAQKWERGEKGKPHVRTLEKVRLFEISPVAFPAYDDTSVSARDMETLLREQEKLWQEEQPTVPLKNHARILTNLIRRLEMEEQIASCRYLH